MLKRILIVAVCLLALNQGWHQFTHRPISQQDGILVATEPQQVAIVDAKPLTVGEFTLTPLASFALQARVLLVSRYRVDAESKLAPYDLGVGWQRMSDSSVLRGLKLSQSARFLLWHWRDAPPIPEDEITRSATNIHLIPANRSVESRIAALRPGQIVSLRGRLVEASTANGWRWRSSLSREDSGSGACELMYVDDIGD
ncbi:MAG: hypothetical protein SGI99_04010 [Pseudomonadota bacterium]|nr:hypothetical protein [Pseudomonadota bacterium]